MATEGNSGSASGGQLEERTDFTVDTDLALTQCASLLHSVTDESNSTPSSTATTILSDVLQILYTLEKRCRVGNDHKNLARICITAIQSCYDVHDYTTLLSTMVSIATKRSQKMSAIRAIVTTAVPWCIAVNDVNDSASTATATATATSTAGGTETVDTRNGTTTTTTTTPPSNASTATSTNTTMNFTPISTTNEIDTKHRNELIVCLRDITSGKLYLERERAQLTRALAMIKVRPRSVTTP
jgi:hypothetical protein